MKKYVTIFDDCYVHGRATWCVVDVGDGVRVVAEFVGKNAGQYAREHAKRLNALPEKEKP